MLDDIYPHTKNLIELDCTSKGNFTPLGPSGCTIHYTADGSVESAVNGLKKADLGYHLIIDRNGDVSQMTSLSKRVWHAGKAVWMGKSPNQNHVSVALVSWGFLTRDRKDDVFRTYSGKVIGVGEIAERPHNITGVMDHWHAATPEQEASLQTILHWFISKGMDPGQVCGHDEAAIPPGRKSDPGGVLSLRMQDLRKALHIFAQSKSEGSKIV